MTVTYEECWDDFTMVKRKTWFVDFAPDGDSEEGEQGEHALLHEPIEGMTPEANVVSSLAENGYHYPALDIDVEMLVVPSSTEGHYHLYFPNIQLSTEQYAKLLDVLAECGIVQRFWADRIKTNGQTVLRMPHVKKGEPS